MSDLTDKVKAAVEADMQQAFVNAMTPERGHGETPIDNTLALLAALQAEVERLTKDRDHWKANAKNQAEIRRVTLTRPDLKERSEYVQQIIAERDALRAKVGELERDKARLNWFESAEFAIGHPTAQDKTWWLFSDDASKDTSGNTLREAIDRAMRGESKP